jgi:predicted dehydrogenase
MDEGLQAHDRDLIKKVQRFSQGHGVDAVLITASTDSAEPLSQAFQMCRKKGKVVLSGVVGMHINRADMYPKESDFLISTSYGPGRYDEQYEKRGVDYPYAYVRWTERRNMEEYLRLIADERIRIEPLIEKIHAVDDAKKAYTAIRSDKDKPLISLLAYDAARKEEPAARITLEIKPVKKEGRINVALIGAGDFAKSILLPNLKKLDSTYALQSVVDKIGHNAAAAAKEFGAEAASTDYQSILNDESIDAVIIATRHNRHARIAMDALNAGKAVFLEKPMAMNQAELDELAETIQKTKQPFMMGFNRRFSKYAVEAKRHIRDRKSPLIVNYQMNAGYIPLDHWVHTEEGGGRIIGEACHIFDLFHFFSEAGVASVCAARIKPEGHGYSPEDNAVITITYQDGSVGTLTYTALGHSSYPKEMCHMYFDGKIIVIRNYESIQGFGVKTKSLTSKSPDKGHLEELAAFAEYVKGEAPPPIPLEHMIQAAETSFRVSDGLS